MINYELALLIAVLSYVYVNRLTQPEKIFNKLQNWLDERLNTRERAYAGKGIHPLYLILIGCAECNAGQISLWLYPILNYSHYSPLSHVLFVGFTIFCASIITRISNKHD